MTRREQLGLGSAGIWAQFFDYERKQWTEVVGGESAPYEEWQSLAKRGGYPAAALLPPSDHVEADRQEIFAGYTQTYLERDLRDLAAIENLYDFQRLMRATCLRLGQVVNQVELARDTGLPRSTVQRHLNLLEVSYQLVRVEPYSVNPTKRLIKSPKIYWNDTGLARHLAQVDGVSGAHLENVVCTDLLTWRETDTARPAILYWRTSNGDEVDFVVERHGKARDRNQSNEHSRLQRYQRPARPPSRVPCGCARWPTSPWRQGHFLDCRRRARGSVVENHLSWCSSRPPRGSAPKSESTHSSRKNLAAMPPIIRNVYCANRSGRTQFEGSNSE